MGHQTHATPHRRTKAAIVTELGQCTRHKDAAVRSLDLIAYAELVERIDLLLAELHAMMVRSL